MADFTSEEVVEIAHKLERADLRKLRLGGANLRWADLSGANLYNVDLSGAILFRANLFKADLREAKYNANTKWPVLPQPEGFDPEAAGAVLVGG
jgi:hypothetical protein